jgi:import inner membrane translocase subunit TIM23
VFLHSCFTTKKQKNNNKKKKWQQKAGAAPEYLFESSKTKQRSSTEKLFYGTGIAYIVGQTIGGTWGFVEGLQHPEGSTTKLRINAILNSCTRRGPFLGNNFGVIALMFSGAAAGMRALPLPVPDEASAVVAGGLAGGLFKLTSTSCCFTCVVENRFEAVVGSTDVLGGIDLCFYIRKPCCFLFFETQLLIALHRWSTQDGFGQCTGRYAWRGHGVG